MASEIFFAMYRKPYAFYVDPGQHFDQELKEFLHREGIAIDCSPLASHKSTGMIEAMNTALERVVRKVGKDWDISPGSSVNSGIISYLGTSPKSIVLDPLPETSLTTATLRALPGRDIQPWATQMQNSW